MSCVLCLLDDKFQARLRTLSQSKSERFEEVIHDFQKNLINALKFSTRVGDCKIHAYLHVETKKAADSYLQSLHTISDIGPFCDSLREVYMLWIKGSPEGAEEMLKGVLESKDLLHYSKKVNNLTFYRGRKSSQILTKEDLFHIPFNKRHLIGNQRYSITGQPLLYLGLSPIDVVYEIRQSIDTLQDIYFCSLLHTSATPLKVLDITNEYPDYFTNYEFVTRDGIGPGGLSQTLETKDFYKFILEQFCSFRRSRWSEAGVFAEEYVLSQLLTGVLRKFNFDGILFSSTRFDSDRCYSKAEFHVNRHRENLALFTKYNADDNFDRGLYEQFLISKPVCISDVINLTQDDLSQLSREVAPLWKQFVREQFELPFSLEISEILATRTRTRFADLVIKTRGTEIPYFEHDLGKLHLHLLYQIMLEFRNRLTND